MHSIGGSHLFTDWDKPKSLCVRFLAILFDADCDAWIKFGGDTTATAADITARGYALKIDGANNLKLLAHNGTTLTTSATLLTLTDRVIYSAMIVHDGVGGWELFVNNSSVGSGSGGPTGLIGSPNTCITVAVTNGSGTGNAFQYLDKFDKYESY
jgi:hypothetical protein